MVKEELLKRKVALQEEIVAIDDKIRILTNLEKPYVANVSAYSGHYEMQFKTVEQARKKLDFYYSRDYFKNGLNYGVYLYKHNEDGTKTLIENRPKGRKDFTPNI